MSPRADFISAIVMTVVAVAFVLAADTIEYDPAEPGIGPRAVPIAVSLLICALSLGMIVRSFRAVRDSGWDLIDRDELRLFAVWVLPMAAITFAYVLLIDMFQYLLPTVAVSAATLALFGNRGKIWLIVTPILAGLFYYVVFFGMFRLLEAPGSIIEYENNAIFGPLRTAIGI